MNLQQSICIYILAFSLVFYRIPDCVGVKEWTSDSLSWAHSLCCCVQVQCDIFHWSFYAFFCSILLLSLRNFFFSNKSQKGGRPWHKRTWGGTERSKRKEIISSVYYVKKESIFNKSKKDCLITVKFYLSPHFLPISLYVAWFNEHLGNFLKEFTLLFFHKLQVLRFQIFDNKNYIHYLCTTICNLQLKLFLHIYNI